ncbi:MAG: hypothetical protein PHH14_01105 [Candidatus Margulisbacteria bacterium]|nr:hypothetical protein [Candidatus Margulisiibacteriota bacterium]
MKNSKTLVPVILLLIIAGFFCWAIYAPKEDLSQRIYQTIKEQEKRADLAFNRVDFEEINAGQKYWQLSAATAFINKDTGVATLQKADGTFFKAGRPVLKFRSPAALWDMKKKEIFLDKPLGYDISLEKKIAALAQGNKNNHTSVFNLPQTYDHNAGYWFQSSNLSWRLADQLLICTGGIILTKGEVTGRAEKLLSDVGLENIRLEGKPLLVLTTTSAPITLEAVIFEVKSKQGLFIARGEPKTTWRDAQIFARDASYHQDDARIDFNGDVKIYYKDITAFGDAASYLTKEQKVIVTGRANAQQGENKLSGDKLIVSLKDKKISLSGKGRVVISE